MKKATSMILALLLVGGGFLAFIPMTMTVSAANIPSTISGEWIVTGTEEYDGGSCVLSGNLTVQSGGSLTLKNLTLAQDNTFEGQYWIMVESNATLKVLGSTIKSNTVDNSMYLMTDGTLQIENSTIQDLGPEWWWYGVVVNMGSATIKNSTFQNNDYGVVVWSGSLTLEDSVFKNNLEGALIVQMGTPTVRNITVTGSGSGGGGGWGGAVYVAWGAGLNLYDSTITNNNVQGLMIEEASAEIYNSTIKNNQNADIEISSWGGGGTCAAHVTNVEFGTVNIDPWGMGGTCALHVYWYANLSATWESDGAPVSDGDFEIIDRDSNPVQDGDLEVTGEKRYLKVKEYEEKSTGKTTFTPHVFNVTGNRDGKVRTGGAEISVNKNLKDDIEIVLDDVPPALAITEPAEGTGTNQSYITLKGTTDVGSTLFVNDVLTSIDGAGQFVTSVDLDVEGVNEIVVRSQDAVGNEVMAEVNVTRDTIVPDLTIDAPADGSLFNYSDIVVSGTTEVGTNLSINDAYVTVNADGTYTTTLDLEQGVHAIVAISRDDVGNQAKVQVELEVDLTPPVLTIMEPVTDFMTKEPTVKVMGVTEPKASVTVNDRPVTLSGSMFQTSVNLVEGENTIIVKSCDIAGNCAIETVVGDRDSTPPILTVTNPPTNDEMLVNVEEIEVTGLTEYGVELTIDGTDVTVEDSGSFTKTVFLTEGLNSIIVRAEDDFGNSAQITRKVRRDTIPPELTVTAPVDGFLTRESQVEIKGTVEMGATVTLNGDGVSTMAGTFSKIVDLKTEGVNNFTVVAVDDAGNSETVTFKVHRDSSIVLVIEGPVDGLKTKNETVTVFGITDPEASVKVNNETLTANMAGRFTVTLDLEIGDTEIVVKVEDELGNKDEATLTVTRQKMAEPGPGTPGVDGGLGSMLWILILVVIIVVVVVLVAVMMKRKKGGATPETTPEQPPEQPQVQAQPQGYQGYDQQNAYGDTQYQQPPPPPPPY